MNANNFNELDLDPKIFSFHTSTSSGKYDITTWMYSQMENVVIAYDKVRTTHSTFI